jgi:hypothetical protein
LCSSKLKRKRAAPSIAALLHSKGLRSTSLHNLKEKVSQRQLDKENILQLLRTQTQFSSINFASSPDLVDPEWFVALQAKVHSAAASAMNEGGGLSLDDEADF